MQVYQDFENYLREKDALEDMLVFDEEPPKAIWFLCI